jgi:hypothetical protein
MTASISPSPILPTASMAPVQTEVATHCDKYYTAQRNDSCASINAKFAITFAMFSEWNPTSKLLLMDCTCSRLTYAQVGPNCENLWLEHAYCVDGPTLRELDRAPVREGTARDCMGYCTVQILDTCRSIKRKFRVSLEDLYKWNTDIGSNCEDLWPGYALCISGGP